MGEFILTLLHAATNTHILHLRSKSFSEHSALGEFYQALPDLVDAVVEATQGRYGDLIDEIASQIDSTLYKLKFLK